MSQTLFGIIVSAALNFLIGLSCYIGYLPLRFINLANGAIIALAASCLYALVVMWHVDVWISIIVAILFCIGVGVALEKFLFRHLRETTAIGWRPLIASLGVYIILQNSISIVFGDNILLLHDQKIGTSHVIGAIYFTDSQVAIIALTAILAASVAALLQYSQVGRAIRALSINPELFDLFGLKSERIVLLSVVVGTSLAAVAGALSALDTDITPGMGFRLLMNGIVVMLIGGVGRLWGMVWGALLLATAQNLTSYYLDSKWMDAVSFLILITFLIWKPLGFSGRRLKKIEI